ncbi:hypothetical protein KUTeg_004396 [Tegillarca granosa]|uniref:Uncharacterized protein n=1 Tax=Tegillarca granosa TaxID=220873 RepID=A0ABQ9FUC0_TEGGR|nr:hypothetical protein KUTeg_004396 [Tegillarca granosa]
MKPITDKNGDKTDISYSCWKVCHYTDILADPNLVPDTRILGWYGTSGTADPVNGWIVPVPTFPEPNPIIKIVFPGLYPVKVTNVTVIGNADTVSVKITGQCSYSSNSFRNTETASSTTGTTVVIFDTLPCADEVKVTLTNVTGSINGSYHVDIRIYGCEVDGNCNSPYKELLQQVPLYQIVEHYSRQLPNTWSIRNGGHSLQTSSFYSTDGPIITLILPPDHVDHFLVRSIEITSSEYEFSISYISSRNNLTFATLVTEINGCGIMASFPEPINIYAIRITSTRTSPLHSVFDFNVLVVACVLSEDLLKGIATEYNEFCQYQLTTEATTKVTTGITDITTTEACCACSTTLPPLTTPEPMTIQEAEEKAQKLRKELSVDVKTLSSTIRKKVSAKDERPSSQLFGVFGVVFIVVVFGSIIIVDIPNLFKTIKVTWKIVSEYLSRKRS